MDMNYVTAYQEVLLENLDAILKQNFQFQTRLKLYEMDSNKQAELQAKFNELSANYQEAVNKLDEFKNSSQVYKVQAESSDAIVQEKNRIQSLYESMGVAFGNEMNGLKVKKETAEEVEEVEEATHGDYKEMYSEEEDEDMDSEEEDEE